MFNLLKNKKIMQYINRNTKLFLLVSFAISFSVFQMLGANKNTLFAGDKKANKETQTTTNNIKVGTIDITSINADEFTTNTISKIQEYYETQYKELEKKSNSVDNDTETKIKKLDSTKEQNIISNDKYNQEKTKIQNDYSAKKQKIATEAELLHKKLMSSIEMMYETIKQTAEHVAKEKNLVLVTEKHYIYYQSNNIQEINITEDILNAIKNNSDIIAIKDNTKAFFENENKK